MRRMTAGDAKELKTAFESLKAKNPALRIRNAAAELGVSEAQLVALSCGQTVTRLEGDWKAFLLEAPSLGRAMALTRNDACVHERSGHYENVSFENDHVGLVVGPDVDLRLFMNRWKLGYMVEETSKHGTRKSFQFFDADGTAVHKIYRLEETDAEAFDALGAKYRSANQEPLQEVEETPAPAPDRPDAEIDLDRFLQGWDALQDTHDFHFLLHKNKIGRVQALRLAGPERAFGLEIPAVRQVLEAAARTELPIMVFVGNPGCIQIHTGPVRTVKEAAGWFNVLDPDFNLHLQEQRIDSAWVVKKPSRDGVVTSVEVYDSAGRQIVTFFGKRKPGIPELEDWRTLVATLPRLQERKVYA